MAYDCASTCCEWLTCSIACMLSIEAVRSRITGTTTVSATATSSSARRHFWFGSDDVGTDIRFARHGKRRTPDASTAPPSAPIIAAAPLEMQPCPRSVAGDARRQEEHTSELQSLMRISYAGYCFKTK